MLAIVLVSTSTVVVLYSMLSWPQVSTAASYTIKLVDFTIKSISFK